MVNLDKSVLIETSDAFVLGLSGLSLIEVALSKNWSRETYEKVQINIQLINKARDKKAMFDYLIGTRA